MARLIVVIVAAFVVLKMISLGCTIVLAQQHPVLTFFSTLLFLD